MSECDDKKEMRDKISKLNPRQLKGAITRSNKDCQKHAETCRQCGIPLYETWGHVKMEILYEFAPSLNDPKYISKCREVLDELYKKRKIGFVVKLLKSKRRSE